jgi:mono/diheme cytochrome c family protein
MPKILRAISTVLLACFWAACAPKPTAQPASEQSLAVGAGVYEQYCAICHFDGEGNPIVPSIVGAPSVGQPDATELLRIILHGSSSDRGIMPKQDFLTDEEAAGVAAYVRKTYGNIDLAVSTELAARVRAQKATP